MTYSNKVFEKCTTTTKCETLEVLQINESNSYESRIKSNLELDEIISYIEEALSCKDLNFILLTYNQKNLPQTMKIIRNNDFNNLEIKFKKMASEIKLKF